MVATTMDREQLKVAFDAFNHQSGLLEQSYRDLQFKVEALTRALNSEQAARVKQLEKNEQISHRLAELLESLPGGIVVIDGEGQIIQHNSEAAELLGQPLLDCSWASIVQREVHGGRSEDGNIQLRDGRWLSLSRRRLRDEPGEILLLADVTDSRQMSELRQRRERLTSIGKMTAEFAHQVRTPLASAMLYAAQLDTGTASQQRIAQKISERLGDLGRMVDDMLAFAGGPRTASDVVNVAELIRSATASMEDQIKAGTELHCLVADDKLCVEGNADALKGAVMNLVNNADQAGSRRIIIGARRVADDVCVSVSDNGPGIPDELLPRVFDAFFTTRPQGTGLGLSVVKAVAAAHNGSATVSSSSLGTTFTLKLPVAE
ncbi:MAG: ATP-binding protein [Woeseiaceae bacterium]|nr:ATP-binding protein [Woeseiaceae bacterium]